MTKKIFIWFCLILFAGAATAAAADSRYSFADDQASIAMPSDVKVHPSPGLPPNNELFNLVRGGRRILGVYAGDYPDTRSLKGLTATKETIAGRPALTYHPAGGKGLSRQTLVEFRDDGFPNVVHFFYSGLTEKEAAIADKMIESLRSDRAPVARK